MTRNSLVLAAIGISASVSFPQPASSGPYRILRTAKVGGTGGFDYVFADAVGRRLYIPRSGQGARVTVLPPRPFFSTLSFATMRVGTDSVAAVRLH